MLAGSCSPGIQYNTHGHHGRFSTAQPARNPGSFATTMPHNEWDHRTTALGIIVSAIASHARFAGVVIVSDKSLGRAGQQDQ